MELTISQQLAKHREDRLRRLSSTYGPMGLSFERFDAIGRWRDKYDEDISIDVGGTLPDGFVLGSVSDLQNCC